VTTALVTGAASGIGAAVARRLSADGAHVVGVDLVAGDGVRRCDVTSTEEVAAVAASLERLDVLVNVAGIPQFGRVEQISDEEWERVLAVDLTGAFKVVRATLPLLRASRGCIVNLASIAGIQGQAYTAAYSAAKGGLVSFTRSLAVELAPDGVRASCVCPAGVDTPLLAQAQFPDDADARLIDRLTGPLDGAVLASPDAVADAVAWLISPAAATVTGIALPMDGGRSA
jgi:meso-butanediol dehydrogenase / (S,S)-butanediol dehydrogenase / diacetyl reductase